MSVQRELRVIRHSQDRSGSRTQVWLLSKCEEEEEEEEEEERRRRKKKKKKKEEERHGICLSEELRGFC
jgi:hypothetical protein